MTVHNYPSSFFLFEIKVTVAKKKLYSIYINETQLELIVGRVGKLCIQDFQDVFLLRKKKE